MHIPYGNNLRLYIEGESRGEYISAKLYNFPSGFKIDEKKLCQFMSRRSPSKSSFSTTRKETDRPVFVSGIFDSTTTGCPIEIRIYNEDAKPTDTDYNDTPRPSHADYPAAVKYGGKCDLRGGGHFSGRLTAPLCAAGGICLQYLESLGIRVFAHIYEIGGIYDEKFDPMNPEKPEKAECGIDVLDNSRGLEMQKRMADVKAAGDSCGGIVECAVTGISPGLGEHMFAGIEGRISSALFAVPSVKSVEFGDGFGLCSMTGSDSNDGYVTDGQTVSTITNHSGGIAGGMTTGMPVIVRAGLKPIPSISLPQKTVSLSKMENTEIRLKGRNDCCAVPRAVPVIEAAVALAVTDILLDLPVKTGELEELRRDIDIADRNLIAAYNARMNAVERIGEIKAVAGSSVYVKSREDAVIRNASALSDPRFRQQTEALYSSILKISKDFQGTTHPALRGFGDKKIYLIGHPLGHSLSPEIHGYLGDYSYSLKELQPEELESFVKSRDFDGLNVTIPYKKKILPLMDSLSPEAEATGAVNTVVKLADGSLRGYNTDVHGFGYMFDLLCSDERYSEMTAVIAGNGGAAAAVKHALSLKGYTDIITVTRKDQDTARPEEIPGLTEGKNYILINATPVGMYPDIAGCVFEDEVIAKASAVVDLVYNPFRTALYIKAAEKGVPCICGLSMLVCQAAESARIFTGSGLDINVPAIIKKIRKESVNTVLIGMPGCGKTSIGAELAKQSGMAFLDTDAEIEQKSGSSCRDIILGSGEAYFRELESAECIKTALLKHTTVSAGGGAVTRPENYLYLKAQGPVVWVKRPLEELEIDGRPLSEKAGVQALYEQRKELYKAFSDFEIQVFESPDATAEKIAAGLDAYLKELL